MGAGRERGSNEALIEERACGGEIQKRKFLHTFAQHISPHHIHTCNVFH